MRVALALLITIFLPGLLLLLAGCSSTNKSNTARTAREQMLVSNAIDQSLSKIDFTGFSGAKVFIEDKYLDCVDKGYLIGSVRHRSMINGAKIVTKPEEADVVLELRSGAIGTDMADAFLGSPEIVLPGMMTLPEIRLISRSQQTAMAKIGLVAYNAKTQQLLGEGGISASKSDDNNWFVMGVGPYQNGSVRKEVDRTTPRYAGQPWQELPPQVAFRGGSGLEPAGSAGAYRLTNEEQPEK